MAHKIPTILKRIDDVCLPIFNLGGEKGVKSKDIEKHYNKGPLADLAFELFSCLYDARRQLDDQNKNIMRATNALKEKERKIHELDNSLTEKEVEIAEQSTINDLLLEVRKNRAQIAEISASLEQKSQSIASEAKKVSSYAEILKRSADSKQIPDSSSTLQSEKVAKRVIEDFKASDRKKNIILYGIPIKFKTEEMKYDYEEAIDDMLLRLGLGGNGIQPSSIEVLKKVASDIPLRPIFTLRLQFPHESTAARVLSNAWKLKRTDDYGTTYIAPERTLNEQREWKKLVEKLKNRIKTEPSAKWAIRTQKGGSCKVWTLASSVE